MYHYHRNGYRCSDGEYYLDGWAWQSRFSATAPITWSCGSFAPPSIRLHANTAPESDDKDAIKRLDAIASLEDLGAGFALATHDLNSWRGWTVGVMSRVVKSIRLALRCIWKCLSKQLKHWKEGPETIAWWPTAAREQTEIEMRFACVIARWLYPRHQYSIIDLQAYCERQWHGWTGRA